MHKIYLFVILSMYIIGCTTNEPSVSKPEIVQRYNLQITDIHNHDAEFNKYYNTLSIWEKYNVTRIVLFGAISEPAAIQSDINLWKAYKQFPDLVIPFFSGFDIHDISCLDTIRNKFERGYYGIGEFVAASTNSPIASLLPWKGNHPMDGYFPQVYELCAEYKAPILLHIDPPYGTPITKLKQALNSYPNTTFIFAHANAFNSPSNIESLLRDHTNLYIDFFPGFTAYNPASTNTLADFVPVIEQYSNRFLLSSDSAYDINYDDAYMAMYELFEFLETSTIHKIAHENFEEIIALRKSVIDE